MSKDEDAIEYTAEQLLETVLNIAASAVDAQFDDDTREALWVILDATAEAYGISVEREGDTQTPPKGFPFRITDISNDKDN